MEKKLKDEFKISYNYDEDLDDEYERELEKDIEKNCDQFNVYIDKLELEEKNDSDIYQMEKFQIIDFKNYQINKLKAYVVSLEKEKEDLIENFKNTTNILLERIKDLEQNLYGNRPQTPNIMAQLKKNEKLEKNIKNLNELNKIREEKKTPTNERCANCKKEFPQEEIIMHSLRCLRNQRSCKICKELISDNHKKDHLDEWRSIEKVILALNNRDKSMLIKCLDHGLNPNKIINENEGDTILHIIAKIGDFSLLEGLLSKDVNINVLNNKKESALFIALNEKNIKMSKSLIELGSDITMRNPADLTPLMLCCKLGLIELCELLLNNNANINETNILGDTPLKLAQRFGHEELAMILIQKYKALIRQSSKK